MNKHATSGLLPSDDIFAERMAEIIETIDQGITVYDSAHRLVMWNKQFTALQLIAAEYIYRGAPLAESYLHAARQGVFGSGNPTEITRNRMVSLAAGELIATELITAPSGAHVRVRRFKLDDGGFVATYSNVTDQLRAEQQQRHAAKLDAIGQLTSGIAHDLNNLLIVILGNLDMATKPGEKVNPYLTKAIQAVERGSGSVQRLLAFARQQPLEAKLTDIGELLTDFLPLFPPMLGEQIDIKLLKPAIPLFSKIDSNQLESVVMNLVINSKDAITNTGNIIIKLDSSTIGVKRASALDIEPGQYVQIDVSDDGCGMTAKTAENALQPFFTTKPGGVGTGLGLASAHGFCQQCGGAIEIESQPGLGTTVTLYIPRAEQRLPAGL